MATRDALVAALPVLERADVLRIQGLAERTAGAKAPEPLGKCQVDGENVTASMKINPVTDSVETADNGVDSTGLCPFCTTRVRLSAKGKIGAHVMRGESLPKSPELSEPNVAPTDTGARVGDPEAQARKRTTELAGAYGHGTVSVKVKPEGDPKGKAKAMDVPATLANIELAYTQAKERLERMYKVREKWSAQKCAERREPLDAQLALIDSLLRMVRAARKGAGVYQAPAQTVSKGMLVNAKGPVADGRDAGVLPGPALVRGRDKGTQTLEQWQRGQDAREERGKTGPQRTTMDEPLGRERADRTITGPAVVEVPVRRTRTQRRNWQRRQAAKAARGQAERGQVAGLLAKVQEGSSAEVWRRALESLAGK